MVLLGRKKRRNSDQDVGRAGDAVWAIGLYANCVRDFRPCLFDTRGPTDHSLRNEG